MSYGNNGYGSDDVYGQMDRAREQGGARFPFIGRGRHILALVTLEKTKTQKHGEVVRSLWKVVSTDNPQKHPIGSYCTKIFKIHERPKFDSSLSDAEHLANMCIALKNAPKGHPIGRDIRTLLEERPGEQLARGSKIECNGVDNEKGNWTNLYWSPVPQTREEIVALRQQIEAEGVPGVKATAPMPPVASGPYAAPGMQGFTPPPQATTYPHQGPVAAPAPQPQQGGFLAQLPPQGQGNGGGNQGGGSW